MALQETLQAVEISKWEWDVDSYDSDPALGSSIHLNRRRFGSSAEVVVNGKQPDTNYNKSHTNITLLEPAQKITCARATPNHGNFSISFDKTFFEQFLSRATNTNEIIHS